MIKLLKSSCALYGARVFIVFDSDLNVFYFGGSGGFLFFHYLLLARKHFSWIEAAPDLAKSYTDQLSDLSTLRLNKAGYDDVKDTGWPDYTEYLHNIPTELTPELEELHKQYATNLETLPGWFDYQLNDIIEQQWTIKDSWKNSEHPPDNQKTQTACSVGRPYKIYLTVNEVDRWLDLPGRRVVLYTDLKSQLTLSQYKKAWYFYNTTNIDINKMIADKGMPYQEITIYNELKKVMAAADQCVYLQDLINFYPKNTEQQQLIDHWLNLHPAELKEICNLSGKTTN